MPSDRVRAVDSIEGSNQSAKVQARIKNYMSVKLSIRRPAGLAWEPLGGMSFEFEFEFYGVFYCVV